MSLGASAVAGLREGVERSLGAIPGFRVPGVDRCVFVLSPQSQSGRSNTTPFIAFWALDRF